MKNKWVTIKLRDIYTSNSRGIEPAKYPDERFELYSVPAYEQKCPEIVKGKDIGSNKQIVYPGDLLLCKINPRINRVWIVGDYSSYKKIASTEWICFSRLENLEHSFLSYFFQQDEFRDFLASNVSGVGGSLMRIKPATFIDYLFLLPPLPEQRRIVAKIEELFSNLDAAIAALEQAKAKLVQYRASLLKAAMEGHLTEKWRAENPSLETGEQLLQRILRERREQWEKEQLAAFKAKGQTPPQNWQTKYKEPAAPDTKNLPQLPQGWCWASLDMLTQIASGVTKGQKFAPNVVLYQIPYLRVANVQRGFFDFSEIKTIGATMGDITDLTLQSGDILFTEGGDKDKLGRGWIWENQIKDCIHQNHIFRARLITNAIDPYFISHHGNVFGKEWFKKVGKQTVNLASINMTILKKFPVPLPNAGESSRIVTILFNQLVPIEAQLKIISNAFIRATHLRQAILKRAFDGNLVPQDPNDEPATILLERIRKEQEAAIPIKPRFLAKGRRKKAQEPTHADT
jgi:type I restriction enzyme S subunit